MTAQEILDYLKSRYHERNKRACEGEGWMLPIRVQLIKRVAEVVETEWADAVKFNYWANTITIRTRADAYAGSAGMGLITMYQETWELRMGAFKLESFAKWIEEDRRLCAYADRLNGKNDSDASNT